MIEDEKRGEKPRAKWGDGRIAFTALLPEIAGELTRKAPMSRIYAKHKTRLGVSYRQFIRLVREYRDQASDAAPVGLPGLGAASPSPPAHGRPRTPLYVGPPEERTFHFDPMDAYRKKYD
ncbi:hypothetical protein Rvan_2840 [Rhodomicrobium vannielii ATCC 17100]|uniref:Uncharacterized protein n=1 Tax=Rhodomicrobium vannielii (strain ATCC 17100 / DSM 162 / LMG 4299 / NCIMB 10020 / ATH 3.1.1) TaxID=648757 RepID=E3I8R9_RHOVT|nr:hypothetical protein [Rhodomicrobium vannielii]ADP72048.1 hypothetical protein Rvan_2840 [Rhodomicrobium vannielii ATCC 17100]